MATSSSLGSGSVSHISKRVVLSYVIDWIVVIGIAGIGGGVSKATPFHRPFDLTNPAISFPHVVKERIPTAALAAIALAAPAMIIFFICLFLVPGPNVRKGMPKSAMLRLKLWEWHTGWLGLALSLATTLIITEGIKNLTGKPRPDLLSRCDADFTLLDANTVGGSGKSIAQGINLVSSGICRQRDQGTLNAGFESYPSGHASFSFAGLTYLTLFICSKFALRIPYLFSRSNDPYLALHHLQLRVKPESSAIIPIRQQNAAPPVYLLIPALIPICAAAYISSTRYTDFRHDGFDIFSGAILGFTVAWASFRMYHLPVRRGAGWSWGPRSADRAWGVRVGVPSYADSIGEDVEQNHTSSATKEAWPNSSRSEDLEAGTQPEAQHGTQSGTQAVSERRVMTERSERNEHA